MDRGATMAFHCIVAMLEQYPNRLNRYGSVCSGKIALGFKKIEHLYPSAKSLNAILTERMMLYVPKLVIE